MSSQSASYLMEDAREAGRLAAKVDAEAWVKKYLSPNLLPGMRVLEVGCGPGHLSASAAILHSDCAFIGVDLVSDRFEYSTPPANLSLQQGDANHLSFPNASFDVVFCRLLLQYLKNPTQVIAEYARVLRPGGLLLLQDLDGQLVWHWPLESDLHSAIDKVVQHLALSGFDPHVGRKLYGMVYQVGLENLSLSVEPYHLFAGPIDDLNERLWTLKLDIAKKHISAALGSDGEATQFIERFMNLLRSPEVFTYSIQITVTGRRPM